MSQLGIKNEKKITMFNASIEPVEALGCKLISYAGYNAKIECQTCGKSHTAGLANYIKNGYGCPYCNIDKILRDRDSNKMRNYLDDESHKFVYFEYLKKRCFENFGTSDFIIGEYGKMYEKIKCNCVEHGEYYTIPNDLINGHLINRGCPECSFSKQLDFDHVKNVIGEIHEHYPVKNYASGRVTLECPIHGEFTSDYNNVKNFKTGCPKCSNQVSKAEIEIQQFLHENKINFQGSDRTILDGLGKRNRALELDIVVESRKLCIEYNGLLYHSYSTADSLGLNPNEINSKHHLIKTEACESKGYKLLQIFDIEWNDAIKGKIWKSMIKSNVGVATKIFARKCKLIEIDSKSAYEFMNDNHIQGRGLIKAYEINLGLMHNNVLVQVMSFKEGDRFSKKSNTSGVYELYRFASILNHNIIGGASKILNYFEQRYEPNLLISYANRRWSQGKVYEKLGFANVSNKDNAPAMIIYDSRSNKILDRRTLWNENSDKIYPIKFDENGMKLSQVNRIFANGYRLLYDCGSLKFVKNYDELNKFESCDKLKPIEFIEFAKPSKKPTKSSAYVRRFDNVDDRMETKRRIGYETFIKNLEEKFPNKFTYGSFEEMGYLNYGHKIKLICNNCNAELESRPEQILLNLNGCPKCSNVKEEKMVKLNSKENHLKSQQARRLKGYERLIEITNQKWPNQFEFYPFEEIGYTSESDPLKIICKDHGEITIRPSSFKVSKYGCPDCIKEGIKNTKQNKLK